MALRGHGDAWHGERRSGCTGQPMIDHGPRRQEAPATRCRITRTGTMSDPEDAADPPRPHRRSSSQRRRMVPLGQATQRRPRCRWTSEGSSAPRDADPSAPCRPSVRTCMTSPTPDVSRAQDDGRVWTSRKPKTPGDWRSRPVMVDAVASSVLQACVEVHGVLGPGERRVGRRVDAGLRGVVAHLGVTGPGVAARVDAGLPVGADRREVIERRIHGREGNRVLSWHRWVVGGLLDGLAARPRAAGDRGAGCEHRDPRDHRPPGRSPGEGAGVPSGRKEPMVRSAAGTRFEALVTTRIAFPGAPAVASCAAPSALRLGSRGPHGAKAGEAVSSGTIREWCGSQVVRQRFAKPSYEGSTPFRTSEIQALPAARPLNRHGP